MNWTLEVVIVPVTDVDRAKSFYADQLGFDVDHDTDHGDVRFVQLTPPGSGCSIVIGKGLDAMEPGSLKGVQLIVGDLPAARAQLVERGVDVGGIQIAGPTGFRPRTEADTDLDNVGVMSFDDPDGNSWVVQQITARAGTA